MLIEPALATMTASEIHTIMTTGYACIAGSLFAVYISFGACPVYLMSATVMSAAVSLSISKLIYPETEKIDNKKFSFANRFFLRNCFQKAKLLLFEFKGRRVTSGVCFEWSNSRLEIHFSHCG